MSKTHFIYPQSQKASYSNAETIDFQLNFEGRKYKKNSLRMSGSITVESAVGTIVAVDLPLFYDSSIGINAFFSEWSTGCDLLGRLENISDYPRLCKMKETARRAKSQEISSANDIMQLKGPADDTTNAILAGQSNTDYALNFNFKPDFILNNVTADIPFRKTGAIDIQCRLESKIRSLFGSAAGVANIVTVKDLQISYVTYPDDNKNEPIQLFATHMLKQVIESNVAHVSTSVPAICSSVSCTFLPVANDSVYTHNQTELVKLPDFQRVSFGFNDVQNGYISFPLEYQQEILFNYLESLGSKNRNQMSFKNLSSGKNWGLGVKFPSPIDLSKQNISVEIEAGLSSANPHYIFMVFRSIQNL